jgi:propanediol dehydratase small subunit
MEFEADFGDHALVEKGSGRTPSAFPSANRSGPTRAYPVGNDHPQLVGFRL